MIKFRLLLFGLSVILIIFACTPNSNDEVNDKIRVILDTDANNELDDQHAIAYMLLNDDVFLIEGLTVNRTKHGGGIEKHYEEAERVVKLCGLESQIQIYNGADKGFDEIKDNINSDDFDGYEAVNFIINTARKKSNQKLVLMPIGKLTNIALALLKAPG